MKYLEIRQCSYISTFMFLVSLILNKHFVLIKKKLFPTPSFPILPMIPPLFFFSFNYVIS